MILIFLVTIGVSAFVDSLYAHAIPAAFASMYALILGPGAFTGGSELNRIELVNKLTNDWKNPHEIARFIIKYWYSIKFVASAEKRGSNCSLISFGSLGISVWHFYIDLPYWYSSWSLLNAALLFLIGNRVNHVLFTLRHGQDTEDWNIACASVIAIAESFDSELHRSVVASLPKGSVQSAILAYRNHTT